MKYLGLTLDSRWSFTAHFTDLAPRLEGSALTLSRLLPNLGGPNDRTRKLYINVIKSIALYGAPIWAYQVRTNRRAIQILRRSQRRITGRLIRAYKTTSHAVNSVLAGVPSLELEAIQYKEVYERVTNLRGRDTPVQKNELDTIRETSRRKMVRNWGE
ncbi:PREDICTED: uncharacterized protein LOC108758488 [Trachymyrmex cornetzi]|uniref:uncharacterized protein LOC108758488 n=1 Tax=Trachymyrmex cornetzi TaxID=471704 RepID=UPI00084ED653|nr:PREDICTED: uncharacterized protein LOC108758488 [Trachymyrmex cornetzi]